MGNGKHIVLASVDEQVDDAAFLRRHIGRDSGCAIPQTLCLPDDRIGNIKELEPYFELWKSVPCESGVLEIVVFEHNAESKRVQKIPKMTAGRSLA